MHENDTRNEIVTLPCGQLEGLRLTEARSIAWLGVPYAMPPVGGLRWKAPREVEPWGDRLSARDFRSSSVQMSPQGPVGSEDCLYLNIWRPDHAEDGLPVLVFLHGGGNVAGSGRDFQGWQLAPETNSIVVTVNYRLGAMGFFLHPALRTGDPLDDSGNYGLLDVIQALKWVHRNITYFGGDPANVTLAGQSAGARNALAASLSPLCKGLIHKLYVMSGGLTTADSKLGESKANEILSALLLEDGLASNPIEAEEWISNQTVEEISGFLHQQNAARFAEAIGDTGLRMNAFPHLFEDGTVIPIGGFANLGLPGHPCLPIVLGSTATEFSGFALGDSYFSNHMQSGLLESQAEEKNLYEAAVQYGSELYAAFNVEEVADKWKKASPDSPIFAYRFRWGLRDGVIDPSIRFQIGANHGADIPFYTGDFSGVMQNFPAGVVTERNEPGRKQLSDWMRCYLRGFLHMGDPNGEGPPPWNRWTADPLSPDILALDADEEQAVVQMDKKLLAHDILSGLMKDSRLTAEQRAWLRTYLFAGRFFWKE
ncbi:carboxylesterase family protein [Paenibacillus soyae]|uniref:Carboxylic ester hydrolase n=1 Tax=Paenibacillus soyae TaxID=2969249 RepID=A0A9X2SCP3_9BACL|nr:carboxylesterase family protein [Paenibacillus soyae]MCR2806317.1 carboxylesterase family protein [Paenibacillus soyae]